MIYERFKMCFAFEETTDRIGDAEHTYKTVYFIMSRGRFKKLVDK
jgi:hypothetical protein